MESKTEIKSISRTAEIEKLYPSTVIEWDATEFNETMAQVRRESIIKQHRSFINAGKITLI